MLVLIHYRSQLNAALNVKVLNLPINSWEDLAESDCNVLVWMGTQVHDIFKFAESGTAKQVIYDKHITHLPPEEFLSGLGYEGGIKKVIDGSSVLVSELESFELLPEYPCKIIDVKMLE
jgi:hypothetical protein